MCKHCQLTTPLGAHDLCHACSIRVRSDVRRGVDALEQYLGVWSEFERWLDERGS
jgi:hypothetical protein